MERSIFKRAVSFLLAAVICFSFLIESNGAVMKAHAATQNQKNIVNRADYLYGITWVAQKSVSCRSYNYYYTFYAGNTYHLPYGQGPVANYIGYGVSPEGFISAAANANSLFYQYKSTAGSWYSTYYITDCSGFVSWCWGLTAKQSTRSLADYSTYVGSVNVSNIRNRLQLGDALNRYDYHVVLVTDLIYDSTGVLTGIEITEQTIPETRRTIYSPEGLASSYASYDGIYRYNGTVPEAPYVEKEETWIEKAAFDTMVYRDRNADIAHYTDAELKEHWLSKGIKEGRASSPVFDLQFYLNNNPDLKEAFGTDYEAVYNHYITKGYKERRKTSALFDGAYYCDNNPDVVANYKENFLLHYIDHGIKEGRQASLTYDPDYYWFIRPDVAQTWPDDYAMAAKHYAGHGIVEQIEAYDNKHPVVSNVTISDITADGYTVTCKVTDNWGLKTVAFPTWTLLNDQDDLADDFMNTQTGTKNGDTYTFRVKASDHNNEAGAYVTHIYAIDKGGNKVQVVLETVMVEDPVLQEITLLPSAAYTEEGSYVKNVHPSTTVESLVSQFANEVLTVCDKDGNVITGSAVVGTGSTVNLYVDGELVDTATVVILGDVDGNGIVNSTDYQRIKAAAQGRFVLSAAERIAADIDGNDTIDTTDSALIKEYFLGTFPLHD